MLTDPSAMMTVRDRVLRRVHPAAFLLILAVLAYGLLLPQMGFYWDELPMSWIRYELGPAAMTRYFSTNRPVWGLLYQLTTRLLPQIPVYWEVFGLFWRWMSALLVWGIVRTLWPQRAELAMTTSVLFLLYPGFNQQWTSYLYSHFFIVLCFLLASFLLMLWSMRHGRWYLPLLLTAMILSALNLWMMEYFFVLELFRPFLILQSVLTGPGEAMTVARIRRAFLVWIPYLLVFLANVVWRLFVFNNQVYQPTLLPKLKSAPLLAMLDLARAIAASLYAASIRAWSEAFRFPTPGIDGPRTVAFYAGVTLLAGLVVWAYVGFARRTFPTGESVGWSAIGLGLAAMLTAGGPFWLTGLEVTTAYPANRFTLPFILGVSLVLAGFLALVPRRISLWLVVVLAGLAAGRQALWADSFRRDWATQKDMFWQMMWRAPGLAPGTIVLLNEGALPYYADNSLTGPLNWIYDPQNRSGTMDYVLFYPSSRLGGTLAELSPGRSVTYDFISEVFAGNTSQAVAYYFQPPGCLRLLDPILDPQNRLIPDASLMRDAAALSSSQWISKTASARMPAIYGPEPAHRWCYFFERAELAAQDNDWAEVVALGNEAFRLNDYPNDPVERFVFVEGYAHTGDWSRAVDLSSTSYKVSRSYIGPLLCRLWERIAMKTTESAQRAASLAQIKSMFACASE